MKTRNYVILKSPNNDVVLIYVGPEPTDGNSSYINEAVQRITKDLFNRKYKKGYDILLANAQNLDRLKRTLPELRWNKALKKQLCKI